MTSAPREPLEAPVPGGSLRGWVAGDGEPVLLLHGGPGIAFEYLDGLAADLGAGFRVAGYQQRGLPPSTTEGPFRIEREVEDAVAVLDALGWGRAWVAGHSWGGHLLLHLVLAAPRRLHGGLAVEPIGAVGDGGMAAFEAELLARTPPADGARAAALDQRVARGEGSIDDAIESMRLLWPAYFASRTDVPPFSMRAVSPKAFDDLIAELPEARERLQARLPSIDVPLGFLAGAESPIPADLATEATAARIPGAWAVIVEGAGHFPWYERPGCVRAAIERLVAAAG